MKHHIWIAAGFLLASCMGNPEGPDTGELAKAADRKAQVAIGKCDRLDERLRAVESELAKLRSEG